MEGGHVNEVWALAIKAVWQRQAGSASQRTWITPLSGCTCPLPVQVPAHTCYMRTLMPHVCRCTYTQRRENIEGQKSAQMITAWVIKMITDLGPEPWREESFQTFGICWEISPLGLLCSCFGLLRPLEVCRQGPNQSTVSAFEPPEASCARLRQHLPAWILSS